jgi:hypothetical protein
MISLPVRVSLLGDDRFLIRVRPVARLAEQIKDAGRVAWR